MAKPVTLARGIYHQAIDSIIEADPGFKDEIAMHKFWIMRTHLSKKYQVGTRLGTYLWFQGLNISNSKQEKYLNIGLLA